MQVAALERLYSNDDALLLRNYCKEFEVFGLGGVHQAVAVAFRAIEAIIGGDLSTDRLLAGGLFDGGSMSCGDENHLAAILVGVETY